MLSNIDQLKLDINQVYSNRELLKDTKYRSSIKDTLNLLDRGEIRVCDRSEDGKWSVNAWIKEAILLYFAICDLKPMYAGDIQFFDKIPLKSGWSELGVRVVPPAVARYGSFISAGAILMPSYINIGAFVGRSTMIDTWATVGSCAQVGADVHVSGGVGLGGVLEPPQASPVIIEDGAFLGSRCIVVEGVRVGKEAVLGANVTLTASTPIVDVTGSEPLITKGFVPPRSVVIPGTIPKKFSAGEFGVPCALIIGMRSESTDKKTSLNQALRDYGVSV